MGVSPEQLASVAQPAVQVFVATLQMPFAPVHSAFELHCTQRWVVVLHTGSPAGQAVTLVALHWVHGPVRQAGLFVVVQAMVRPLPVSPLQATQTPFAVSQIGFEPTQAAGFPAVHSTHLFVVVLQTLFVPVHEIVSSAVHATQAPVAKLHAGAAEVGQAGGAAEPLSSLQGTHAPAALQTGVLPPPRRTSGTARRCSGSSECRSPVSGSRTRRC